jgi:LysR family transcriptional activator of nhaA
VEWLNYHHLMYFWMVAREGSIARACDRLHLAQPTVSAQLRSLEQSLGEKLFERQGRRLVLTETGRFVFRYADEIFGLGRELRDALKGRPTGRPMKLAVGIADALPKLVAYRLLEPAMRLAEPVQMVCYEGKPDALHADLAVHALDIVLSDAPLGPGAKVRAFSHQLGECGVAVMGTRALVDALEGPFPACLEGAPFLLPTENTSLRRALDAWLDLSGVRPRTVGEFEDSALIKVFAQAGLGLIFVPTVVAGEVARQYGLVEVTRVEAIRERFYAISVERKLKHPAVVAISDAARRQLFA